MSESLVRKLFPNIPSEHYTEQLSLNSDALHYIERFGSMKDAIEHLKTTCQMCAIDDCGGIFETCRNKKIVELIEKNLIRRD